MIRALIELALTLGVPLAVIVLAMVVGTILERRHFRSIREREERTRDLPVLSTRECPAGEVAEARLVTGEVVVSIDHFKRFLAGLRNIFGGEVRSYCSVLDRGRREAILRMKEQFPEADLIVNLRVETCSVSKSTGGREKSIGAAEVIAYGTAIRFARPDGE